MGEKFFIFTGGTGGHVIPAINLGNHLIKKGHDCSLFLDLRGEKYSKKFKGKIYITRSSHLTGNFFYKLRSILNLIIGFFQSLILIIKNKPHKCISFGSYATFMPMISVLILKNFRKIDIYIHEQNSVIGKVNLFFLPYAKIIFTNFNFVKNLDKKYLLKKCNVGLPKNMNLNIKNKKYFTLNKKKIIFIYGGSQGSVSLIKNILLIIKNLDNNYLNKIKLIIQSPKKISKDIRKDLSDLKLEFEIQEFYFDIEKILSTTNLAITRAGAGTIIDLIKFKIPSIIIPLSHSIHNHQLHNARYLVDKKAAILMDENNFNIAINTDVFKQLIIDNTQLGIMLNALNQIDLLDSNKIMLSKILI